MKSPLPRIVISLLIHSALLLFALAAPDSALGSDRPVDQSPPASTVVSESIVIAGNATAGPYWISGHFIIGASVSVCGSDGRPWESDAYDLDANLGRLTLAEPLRIGDTIVVSFTRLAWSPPGVWAARSPVVEQRPRILRTVNVADYSDRLPGYEFTRKDGPATSGSLPVGLRARPPASARAMRWSGFKSFSLNTRTGGSAGWTQGLQLSLDGELTRGLSLRAAISDRAGNSSTSGTMGRDATRVGDLDRFFIEARSARFYGRMGEISLSDARPNATIRQASGLRIHYAGDVHDITAFVGRPGGRTVRRQLPVLANVDGPYRLPGSPGRSINMVPGSIAVWRDGTRLREGADGDFTFDQSDNTITFNPGAVPDAGALVVAEFEQSLNAYRRTAAGGRWRYGAEQGRFDNMVQVRWEADDPQKPLFGELSAVQRGILAATPDGEVVTSSAEYQGTARGDYTLTVTPGNDTVFTYVGPDNGDWRVRFEFVGNGQGRYRHLADAAYEYAGPGKGDYEPNARLGAPAARMTLAETFTLNTRAYGHLEGTILGQATNANRLASSATRLQADHRLSWRMGRPGDTLAGRSIRIQWRRQTLNDQNREIAIDNLARFTTDWGLRPVYFDSARSEYDIAASFRTGSHGMWTVESALLESHGFQAVRAKAASRVRLIPHVTGELTWNERRAVTRSDAGYGRNADRRWNVRLRIGDTPAEITTGWDEYRLDNPARLFAQRPEYTRTQWMALNRHGASVRIEQTLTRDSLTGEQRRARELSLSLPLNRGTVSSGRLLFGRGEEAFGDRGFSPYYRGQLNSVWRPFRQTTVTADLRLSHGRTGADREVYLPTRPGQGQYRLERGEYIPDVHGDYRRVIARDEETRRTAYDGFQRLSVMSKHHFGGWDWAFESRFDRRGRYDPARFRPGVWLQPWTAADWAAATGSLSERNALQRLWTRPNDATEITIEWNSRLTVISGRMNRRRRDQAGVSLRHYPLRSVYVEGALDYDSRVSERALPSDVCANGRVWRLTLGGVRSSRIDWSLEGRLRRDTDDTRDPVVRLLGCRPRLQATLGSLSILLDLNAAWVTRDVSSGTLSPLLAEGRSLGFSLTEFCELRWNLPGQVTLKSRLTGDTREGAPDRWRWELETIARF